jgi:NTE family protein
MTIEVPATLGIGLTLSGGGARGLAHIGVLKVFEAEGILIGAMSGASMGGIVAAAYSAGWSPDELEREARDMASLRELMKLVDIRTPRRGLLAGQHVRDYLARFTPPELSFSELSRPLALKATDLHAGREVDLDHGPVLEAVLATSALPGVFPAVEWEGRKLVDGGVLNNLPVDLVRRLGANITVAVDVAPKFSDPDGDDLFGAPGHLPSFLQDIYYTVMLMTRAMTRLRLQQETPEVLIQPELPAGVGLFTGFRRAGEIIASGERAALRALPQVIRALEQDQRQNQ